MAHFSTLVFTPAGPTEPEGCVSHAADLLSRHYQGDDWSDGDGTWDWWVVGGRFTGQLDGYDPTTDPANIEICDLCDGTGTRTSWPAHVTDEWAAECGGCNGCRGEGRRVKWPTLWAPHPGDITAASTLLSRHELYLPAAVLTPDGTWHEDPLMYVRGRGAGPADPADEWGALVRRLLTAHGDGAVVLVDCHV